MYKKLVILLIAFPFLLASAQDKPNIVYIMLDDLGWTDLRCYGSKFIDTPNIDKLAEGGLKFTDFYAAGSVCSPTRAAVQSGQNQARIGITTHIPGHWRPFERVQTPQVTMKLPLDIVTVGEAMKKSGYKTGYIGKWHLGGQGFLPEDQGYDYSRVISGPHLPGKYWVVNTKDTQRPKKGQYRTDFEADLSIKFITENKDKPFFLTVSPYAVHIPLGAMSDKVEKYMIRAKETGMSLPHPVYAAMVEHADDMVGRIVAKLDELKLRNKTMIVFTSDNGGLFRRYDFQQGIDDDVTTMAPLRGEKGNLYEAGIRVPLIINYPGRIKGGQVTSEPAISYDFFPTFVAMAGGQLPKNQTIDGRDVSALFQSPNKSLGRDALYWHMPHYHHGRPSSSMRAGKWKLIEYLDNTGDVELFNLAKDIGETTDLAAKHKGVLAKLQKQLKRWRLEVGARMTLINPAYDPDRAHEWWSRRDGKIVESQKRKPFPPTEKSLQNQ